MADGCTLSFAATWQVTRSADRSAFLVAASMCVQTIIINLTLNLDTGYIGVAFVSILAGTHRVVVDHTAEGVFPACTGVFTKLVNARVCVATLVIRCTSSYNGS